MTKKIFCRVKVKKKNIQISIYLPKIYIPPQLLAESTTNLLFLNPPNLLNTLINYLRINPISNQHPNKTLKVNKPNFPLFKMLQNLCLNHFR